MTTTDRTDTRKDDRPREALRELADHAPGAVELAVLTSSAVLLEPDLIRAVRLAFAPQVGASAEADLWISEIVDTREPSAITIVPAVGEVLRSELRSRLVVDTALRTGLDELLRAYHGSLAPTLALEERIRWITVATAEGDIADQIEQLLASALAGVRDRSRVGLARWGGRALRRLPSRAFESPSAVGLAQLLVRRGAVPATQVMAIPGAIESLGLGNVADLIDELGTERLGLIRIGDVLDLGHVGVGGYAIEVPATTPRIVEVNETTVRVPAGGKERVNVGWHGAAEVTTAGGDVFSIEAVAADPTDKLNSACVIVDYGDPAPGAIRVGTVVAGGLVVTLTGDTRDPTKATVSRGTRSVPATVVNRSGDSGLVLLSAPGLDAAAMEVASGSGLAGQTWSGRGLIDRGLVPIAGRYPTPGADEGVEVRRPAGATIAGSPIVVGGAITGVVREVWQPRPDTEWISVLDAEDIRQFLGTSRRIVRISYHEAEVGTAVSLSGILAAQLATMSLTVSLEAHDGADVTYTDAPFGETVAVVVLVSDIELSASRLARLREYRAAAIPVIPVVRPRLLPRLAPELATYQAIEFPDDSASEAPAMDPELAISEVARQIATALAVVVASAVPNPAWSTLRIRRDAKHSQDALEVTFRDPAGADVAVSTRIPKLRSLTDAWQAGRLPPILKAGERIRRDLFRSGLPGSIGMQIDVDPELPPLPWEGLLLDVDGPSGSFESGIGEVIRAVPLHEQRSVKAFSRRAIFLIDGSNVNSESALPYAHRELDEIEQLFGSRGWSVARTTNRAVANRALRSGEFDIVHICAHGTWANDSVSFPLSDGLLEFGRVARPAFGTGPDLVVLSTALPPAAAERVSETATELGATVIVGIGRVTDSAAQTFATGTYKELLSGSWLGLAVRSARQALRGDDPDRASWMSFVCFGDPELQIPSDPAIDEVRSSTVPQIRSFSTGQGSSLVIEYGDPDRRHRIVVDGGPGGSSYERGLGTWLVDLAPEDRRIDLVVATHADADHIGGIVGLLGESSVDIDDLWFNRPDAGRASMVLGNLERYLTDHPRAHNRAFGGRSIASDPDRAAFPQVALVGGMRATILLPFEATLEAFRGGRAPDSSHNDLSLAILFELDGWSILTTGDAPADALEGAIRSYLGANGLDVLEVDALQIPHEGRRDSLTDSLLSLIRADALLLSPSGPPYGPVDLDTIAAFAGANNGARLYVSERTDTVKGWLHDAALQSAGIEVILPEPGTRSVNFNA